MYCIKNRDARNRCPGTIARQEDGNFAIIKNHTCEPEKHKARDGSKGDKAVEVPVLISSVLVVQ